MSSAFQERFKDRRSMIGKEGIIDTKNSAAISKPLDTQVFKPLVYKPKETNISNFETHSIYSYSPPAYTPELNHPIATNTVSQFQNQPKPEPTRKQALSAKPMRNLVPVGKNILRASEGKFLEEYKPYNLKDYQSIKSDKYYELGGLGPSYVGTDEWRSKKEALDKRNSYARQAQAALANFPVVPVIKKREEKEMSSREKALQFAKMIPRPRAKEKAEVEEARKGDFSSILEEMEKKHLADKVSIESIKSGIKY